MSGAADALERAFDGLVSAVGGVSPGWLVLGVALHLLNQVARGRGWHAVVAAACDAGAEPRRRDTVAAWVAGAGAGGVVSARGGDAVRVLVLSRRSPGNSRALLTGTLVAECAGETALGAALLVGGLPVGVGPALGPSATTGLYALAALLAAGGVYLLARRSARVKGFLAKAAHGCALLRCPKAYSRQVLPWQVASRLCRLAALACFLAAFGLPATPAAVLLVVFAQGGGRLVPFAPASVGAGAAMLAAAFAPVTGSSVPAAQVAAFFLGTSAVLTIVGTAVATGILLRDQALASAGQRLVRLGWLGRRTRTR